MTRRPERVSGATPAAEHVPLHSRVPVHALVPIVVALGVLRVPGLDWAYAALGAALLVRSPTVRLGAGPLTVVFAVCAATAWLATVVEGSATGFGSSYLWPVTAQCLFVLGVLATPDPRRQVRRLVTGLTGGLVLVWAIGVGEIVTGIKLIVLLSPSSSMAEHAAASRWVTMAVYSNYNDYCLALAMLAVLLFAHILFVPRVHPFLGLARWSVLGSSVALVLVMGSRGALGAGALAGGLVAVMAVRRVRPRMVSPGRVGIVVLVLTPIALWLWSSPYVQDHSTATRQAILDNSLTLWAANPWTATVGYGSATHYAAVTEAAYPGLLMDPHNVLLEVALNFGVIGLVVALGWWLTLVRDVGLGRTPSHDWAHVGVLALAVALPVTGVVASRLLPYVFVTVIVTAASLVQPGRARSKMTRISG